jgi:hypothetical protein
LLAVGLFIFIDYTLEHGANVLAHEASVKALLGHWPEIGACRSWETFGGQGGRIFADNNKPRGPAFDNLCSAIQPEKRGRLQGRT